MSGLRKIFKSESRTSATENFGLWCLPLRNLHKQAVLSLCSIDKGVRAHTNSHTNSLSFCGYTYACTQGRPKSLIH